MTENLIVSAENLGKRYGDVPVFSGLNLQVRAGEFVAIFGESGVGKSSLLNLFGGLDEPDEGSLSMCGQNLTQLSDSAKAVLRRERMGFVFQAFHVLPHLDVAQNVALPLMLLGQSASSTAAKARVNEVLEAVGLGGLQQRMPTQLSGGQLQRVAIARAVIHKPALILADEPTGNLDPRTAAAVMELLREQAHQHGSALVLVTHAQAAAKAADQIYTLTSTGLEISR